MLTPSLRVPDGDTPAPRRPDGPAPVAEPPASAARDHAPILLTNPATEAETAAPEDDDSDDKASETGNLLAMLVEQEVARAFADEDEDETDTAARADGPAALEPSAPVSEASAPESAAADLPLHEEEEAAPETGSSDVAEFVLHSEGVERRADPGLAPERGEAAGISSEEAEDPETDALQEVAEDESDDEAAPAGASEAANSIGSVIASTPDTAEDFAADSVLERKIAALEELVARQGKIIAPAQDADAPSFLQDTRHRVLNWTGDVAPDPEEPQLSEDEGQTATDAADAGAEPQFEESPAESDGPSSVDESGPHINAVSDMPTEWVDATEHGATEELSPADEAVLAEVVTSPEVDDRQAEPDQAEDSDSQDDLEAEEWTEYAVEAEPVEPEAETPTASYPEAAQPGTYHDVTTVEPSHSAPARPAIDEEILRDMVSDIVRQELQGVLGERITRNVRKLVRREIHRVLMTQDLD